MPDTCENYLRVCRHGLITALQTPVVVCTFVATRVFAHKWPRDTPEWGRAFQRLVNDMINTGTSTGCDTREVVLSDRTVAINGLVFESLKNVGVSIPFFKKECRMIFEGLHAGRHAHVHVYAGLEDEYLDAFGRITRWMRYCGY